MKKVYFASPWFNAAQAEREDRVKNKLRELGFDVWSPKDNNSLSPITDPAIREKIFAANISGMEDCEMIFAITDEKDMGTIWECGFVYGMRHAYNKNHDELFDPLVVYYCETLGDGMFNLMLAQSGDIVITKFEDLNKLPELIAKGEGLAYAGIVE
jgi:nucleoside 2-deoxyribosyltransferase